MTRRARLIWLLALAGAILPVPAGGLAQAPPPAPVAGPEPHAILVMIRLSPDHYRPSRSYAGPYGDRATANARRRQAEQIARRHGLTLAEDGWPMPLLGLDCFLMRVPADQTLEAAGAEVSQDPRVLWAQPLQLYHVQGAVAPSRGADPLLPLQPAEKFWRLDQLHRLATGRGVVVAIVDSQVETKHPDLAGQVVTDRDFVPGRPVAAEIHGTGIAGVIAAKQGNGIGIAGVAPGARLMALRACWQTRTTATSTICDTLALAKAIHYAVDNGAAVINLSLAGPPSRLLESLLDVARARRISVVAAYDPGLPGGGFPASAAGVIPVATDRLRWFPPGVYAAPGDDIPTTQPGGRWFLVNGSSYAAAHVSGLMALLRERARGGTPTLVSTGAGSGPIDACLTIGRVAGGDGCPPEKAGMAASR